MLDVAGQVEKSDGHLRPELIEPSQSLTQNIDAVRQAVQAGFSYLKITYAFPSHDPEGVHTTAEKS